MSLCQTCQAAKPRILRPKTQQPTCLSCFFTSFEDEIHYTIVSNKLFKRGDRVAVGASGGKDSTVMIHVLHHLNAKYDYGIELHLVSIDEGITGYRDDSLETVKKNQLKYELPLTILSYRDLYGWTMDDIVAKIGKTNNCTFCGVFRRQALERGAMHIKADKMVTGHNADDIAETVLMNILRGDTFRLSKTVSIISGGEKKEDNGNPTQAKEPEPSERKEIELEKEKEKEGSSGCLCSKGKAELHEEVETSKEKGAGTIKEEESGCGGESDPLEDLERAPIPRVKPFKYSYEKEIVMYAYHKKLDYFSTECIYAPNAYRGNVRELIKDLERARPSSIVDIIHSGEALKMSKTGKKPVKGKCTRCGFISSNELCKACVLLDGLKEGKAKQVVRVVRGKNKETLMHI